MKTKALPPHKLIENSDIPSLVEAYFQFNHLKQLYRQGWLQRSVPQINCESVAEHSYCVALLALLLANKYPALDKTKVIAMALIHDLGEVHAGDFTPRDQVNPEEKHSLEKQSIERVLSDLSDNQNLIELWEEYEQGLSIEARFVQELDRLEMSLQASVYAQQGLVNPTEFFFSTRKILEQPEFIQVLDNLEALCSSPEDDV